MYKGLYDCFERWYRGGNIWLYSDPHFADEEMKYIRKNYISDEEQIRRINSKVGKNDTIIFLGDIGDIECIKKIRGYKVLIMGNHDKGASNYKRECEVEVSAEGKTYTIDNHLFDEVYEGPLMINEKIILSHEPIDLPFLFNIHGHKHDLPYKYDNAHLNVCAESINYTPVSLISLLKTGVAKNITNIHRITIDNATYRKGKGKN